MIDLELLLKLRLMVARHGEMDCSQWWNTEAMLGEYGASALSRGFPRTHFFAQARVVFAVARSRCSELERRSNTVTLWDLPPEVEEAFEAHWPSFVDDGCDWPTLLGRIEDHDGQDLLRLGEQMDLLLPAHVEVIAGLRRSGTGRGVEVPGAAELDNDMVTVLAAGFSLGKPGELIVPYAELGA